MSSLLPLFVGLPSGTKANGGGGSAAEPLGQVIQGQAQPSGHTVPQAFSQVLRGHEATAGFFTRLPTFVSTRTQPDAAEKTLSESQADRIQAPEVSVLPTSDSDVLPDPASLPSQTLLNVLFVGTNEFAPERVQVAAPQQPPFPVAVPTTVLTPLDGLQTPARPLLQGRGFQPTGGNPTLGPVRQDPAIAQQDEAINQRRTDFEKFLHRLDHTPGKGGHNSLSVDISPSISKFKDLVQIFLAQHNAGPKFAPGLARRVAPQAVLNVGLRSKIPYCSTQHS